MRPPIVRTLTEVSPLDKRRATIAAKLALAGFALNPTCEGGYLITRWDRTAYAPDLRCAEAFLMRVEGRR